MINALSKVTVYVDNVSQGKRFWVEKMGFTIREEAALAPGLIWLEVAASRDGETTIVLYSRDLMKQQNGNPAHPSIIFSCTDIEAVHQTLIEREVTVTNIESFPYGKMFTFYDQDNQSYLIREHSSGN